MSRWLKLLLLGLVVAGAGILLLPWWLGAALRPVLGAQGITFERYERVGYARFRLHGVHYASASVEFTAKQVQAPTPVAWLAQRVRGADPLLTAEGWRVQRLTGGTAVQASAQKQISGLPDLQTALHRLGPKFVSWLPRALLTSGQVHGLGPAITVDRIDWAKSVLTVDGVGAGERRLAFVLTPAADGSITLSAQTVDKDARLQLLWSGAEINGEAVLWEQPLHLAARFPAQGWLPTEASAVAENWRLPASRVKLGAPYAQVTGDARLVWREGAFDLSANAKAEPATDTNAPPFEARAVAHGTLRELTLTELHVDAPFATAKLSAPVTFSLYRPLAAESAQLVVQADLAKMPWLEVAQGKLDGTVVVTGDRTVARQTFELMGGNIRVRDFSLKEVQARGVLAWPELKLTELKVQLDETSSLETHGIVNWQTRELAGVALSAKLSPAWFARWLPAGAGWTVLDATATVEGPLDAPRHQGSLKITAAQLPPLHSFTTEASWQGSGQKTEITAHAQAGQSSLDLTGTLEPGGLRLTKLQLAPGGAPGWQLAAPARIAWAPTWQIENLDLAGHEGRLTLQAGGGSEGSFALTATHFSSAVLKDWITVTGPAWQVQSLQAGGRVVDRVLVWDATLAAEIEMSPAPAQVSLTARGDAQGIELKEFKVTQTERVLTQASGRVPVIWAMTPAPHLVLDETARLELSAATEPDSPLWATLAAATGFQLTQAAAKINLTGTLRQPTGELQVRVAQLNSTPGRFKFPLPEFTNLNLAVQLGRTEVTITTFSAQLDGQAVSASGKLPMDDDHWRQLWRQPSAFDWSGAGARVEIPDVDLAALARRFPNLVAAQGRLSAHVELKPGGKFSGELRLTNAATRGLGSLGALQDIQGDLVLADQLLTARTLTAKLGGEPVALDGRITLMPGAAPRLALTLKGTNLPLVRHTGLLLRADLDLSANTDAAGLTHLGGAINVRDCLVLANINLRTLLPGGRRGVSRLPPYFAVQADPFQHWRLDVALRAPGGAIQVRTTAYRGTASAFFQLGGTLGEPRAVGALTVDEGRVLFPFATFKVHQGTIRLREADPFHAIVNLNATSQRRDFQLRLEMTGELPAPNVTLSSSPALAAADVLLMVMTGQPPAGETIPTVGTSGPRLALLGAYLSRGLFQDLGFSGEERLEISAGEHVSRQGRDTYEFEYKLGERWSLLGEYDEFDAYNAGVKWRVYTQESTPLEKKK
jgi:translocation and assembly module TamB